MRKARELMVGEMIRAIRGGDDPADAEQWFGHCYWRVMGHKHEEKKVVLEFIGGYSNLAARQREIDYETDVVTTPFAYKDMRPELLPNWHVYKEWPYDEEGNFCWPPRDYTN
jgi:hypothetical protein